MISMKLIGFAYLHLKKYSRQAKKTIFKTELKIFVSDLQNLELKEKLFENKLLTKNALSCDGH